MAASLHPVQNHGDRPSCYDAAYTQLWQTLDLTNVTFPMQIRNIQQFEEDNPEFSFMVYGLHGNLVVGPLHATKARKEHHIQLLYITKGEMGHYCLITDLSRLVSRQLSDYHGRKFICEFCLNYFYTQVELTRHCVDCGTHTPVKIRMPTGDEAKMKFNSVAKQETHPFVVYADTECLTVPVQTCQPNPTKKYTNQIQKHIPFAIAYHVVCSYDDSQSYFRSFSGENCIAQFMDDLMQLAEHYEGLLQNPRPMVCTHEDIINFNRATECYLCRRPFQPTDIRVTDHNHITGQVRGIAHQNCNLQFRAPKFIPVFFHNLTGYDSHFLIRHFANLEGES